MSQLPTAARISVKTSKVDVKNFDHPYAIDYHSQGLAAKDHPMTRDEITQHMGGFQWVMTPSHHPSITPMATLATGAVALRLRLGLGCTENGLFERLVHPESRCSPGVYTYHK